MPLHNPYATALDGLELPDPVAAFFQFCKDREQIRIRRAEGLPEPWTDDPIFQRARFLNVFREDDRVSQAIQRFVAPVAHSLEHTVQAVFFARWCNRQTTLDQLTAEQLTHPSDLRHSLQAVPNPPWCNVTAYPVEPVRWQGTVYSRLDAATTLFSAIAPQLVQAIQSAKGDVVHATAQVNAMLNMQNDFPIFMAIMDLAWFFPDVVHPHSPVPTGIGAVAYLDRLQAHLGLDNHEQTCEKMIALQKEYWPQAKRPFQPIDIEYLSCECRKYYSYVNGTKAFEGKNVFSPGRSAQLVFDVDTPTSNTTLTDIVVIAGAPCSGKTSLVSALKNAGHHVERETAEKLIEEGLAAGKTAESLRAFPVVWQQQLLQRDYELFDGLPTNARVFTDTSFIETLVFSARAGVRVGPHIESWLHNKRYGHVFFLEPLTTYEQSAVRLESETLATQISEQVRQCYQEYGYTVVKVPATSIEERLAFIESTLANA